MLVQIIGVPTEGTTARVGERFRLRPGTPLRIGTSFDDRVRLTRGAHTEVRVVSSETSTGLELEELGVRLTLNGVTLTAGSSVPVVSGDCLFIDESLVLRFLDEVEKAPPRQVDLERSVAGADDTADVWNVYLDHLEEQNDPVLTWVRAPHDDAGRRRQLRGLAEAHAAGDVDVTWSTHGFITSLVIKRAATQRSGRVAWLLGQLGALPVARVLSKVSVELFNGGSVDDAEAVRVLDALARADFASSLRTVTLGFVGAGTAWPATDEAWVQLQRVAPLLQGHWAEVVPAGLRARLRLESWTQSASAAWSDVILNPQRTDVGGAPECLLRLIGNVPRIACTLHRTVEGEWVVYDERADLSRVGSVAHALRVNGAPVPRAVLKPGDTIEPVDGVRLRFELLPDGG